MTAQRMVSRGGGIFLGDDVRQPDGRVASSDLDLRPSENRKIEAIITGFFDDGFGATSLREIRPDTTIALAISDSESLQVRVRSRDINRYRFELIDPTQHMSLLRRFQVGDTARLIITRPVDLTDLPEPEVTRSPLAFRAWLILGTAILGWSVFFYFLA